MPESDETDDSGETFRRHHLDWSLAEALAAGFGESGLQAIDERIRMYRADGHEAAVLKWSAVRAKYLVLRALHRRSHDLG